MSRNDRETNSEKSMFDNFVYSEIQFSPLRSRDPAPPSQPEPRRQGRKHAQTSRVRAEGDPFASRRRQLKSEINMYPPGRARSGWGASRAPGEPPCLTH